MGEFDLIDWIRSRTRIGPGVQCGIGDDCAVIDPPAPPRSIIVTTDMLLDGRHFHLAECGAVAAGRKAMGVNLSDIAAMAGAPRYATVAVALPIRDGEAIAKGLFEGLSAMADRYGVALVGGDTNAWNGPLCVSVTIVGETHRRGAVRRSGARAGDLICVTGSLGGSILGRHLSPTPRVDEAAALVDADAATAMIDISDGIASDLRHILNASGLGATIDAAKIPVHPDAELLALRTGRTSLDHALGDGEDFELCVAIRPEFRDEIASAHPRWPWLREIGVFERAPGLRLREARGTVSELTLRGFDHLAAPSAPEASCDTTENHPA
jgi:thiamine-monophosphate kinase